MKKTLFAMLLTLACLTGAQGQRFEWAKGYASAQQGSEIKGTVADREGNLYILGTFRNDARWDGEPLLPITPHGYNPNSINVLIAKISPSGQMVWKKVIHSNAGLNSHAYDIKPVGDTAFACLVQLSLSRAMDNYLYYLDTLIEGDSDYPLPVPYFGRTSYTTYLQFDFDGRVQEQHFLQVGYLDAEGNDLAYPSQLPHIDPTPWYVSDVLYYPSFDVDAAGNIYLSRMAINAMYCCLDSVMEYSVEAGTISAVKYWVDHRLAGVNYIDPHRRPQNGIPELLVFSPHFDTLLTSRYLFQHYVNGAPSTYLKLDKYGNLYALGTISAYHVDDTVVVDAERGISIPITMANQNKGYLVKLDSALTPIYCVTLEDSVRNGDILTSSRSSFYNICFDDDSGLCFVSGFIQRDHGTTALVTFNGVPTGIEKNDAFVISFHMESGDMHSLAVVPSISSSHLGSSYAYNNLTASNNRVFVQNAYYGGVRYPNDTIVLSGNNPSLGISVFDYKGNMIEGHDFRATSPLNRPGPLALIDSALYLSNLFVSSATFGDIAVPQQGYHACIAKYVDTAFMTPYRADTDTGDVRVVMVEDQGAWTYYPNPFRQRVNIEYQGSEPLRTTATLTDATGRSTEVRLSEQGTGRYRLDFAGVPQPRGSRVLFLTLTTASGRQHTLRLMTAWE
jgi:hypothetical protein